jgi:hypothetical protein
MDARQGCLEGTRSAVLQDLSEWANDEAPELTTLWLTGLAGTGKSAIANTFASHMVHEGLLGASFFVDRQVAERQDPHRIVQSLAYNLAVHDHEHLQSLWSTLCAMPTIMDMSLKDQVETLIRVPFIKASARTLVILIDGLDECTPLEGAWLLSTIVSCLSSVPIKLLVASRSDSEITKTFGSIIHSEIRLQDQPLEEVAKDVRSYWEDGLDELCRTRFLPDWRPTVDAELLVHLTGYLFIYATTVFKIIQNTRGSPIRKLCELIELSLSGAGSVIAFVGPDKPSRLEQIYIYILTEAMKDNNGNITREYATRLRDILELVIFSREPLTLSALSGLLDLDRAELDGYLSTMSSVLLLPDAKQDQDVIRPLHQSFPDFVVQQGKNVHLELSVDASAANLHITEFCLERLNTRLRYNICGIQDPSLSNFEVLHLETLVSQNISRSLQYAVKFWAVHEIEYIRAAGSQWRTHKGLELFCNTHLLHWVEALSIMNDLHATLRVMPELLAAIKVSLVFIFQC